MQCVTANLKSCDAETTRQVELELQAAYVKMAANCVPMPGLVVGLLFFSSFSNIDFDILNYTL